MKIIGYHISPAADNTYICANSYGKVCTDDLLNFLLKDTKGAIGVFYHLDYAVAQLLRWLQVDNFNLRKMFENGKLYVAPWTLEYIPRKFLSIEYGGGTYRPFTNLSDMFQYHHVGDLTELDVIEYAKLARDIGQEVYDTLVDIGLNPKSLVSPVNTFGKDVLSTLDLPTVRDIPDEVGEMAFGCLSGSWVEAFQKGHFKEVYDYDLKGAYSAQLAQLIDTREGKWIKSKEYIDDAYYGYCKCWVNIEKDFSPVQYSKGDNNNSTPKGPFPKKLNKAYIDVLDEFGIGSCEIIDGWWWIPEGDELVYPLEEMIVDLNNMKDKAKSKLAKQVIKRIPNGIWGKLIETRKDDECYNYFPPWAVECEAGTSLADARFVLENDLFPDYLLHITVDGVLSSSFVDLVNENGMGSWQLSLQGKAIVIGSGMCAIEGKDGEGDFALNYDKLVDMIFNDPECSSYSMSKLSPVSLSAAIKDDKIDKLGKHAVITTSIVVNGWDKRDFPEVPGNGRELLDGQYKSIPWDISIVQGMPDKNSKAEDYEQ